MSGKMPGAPLLPRMLMYNHLFEENHQSFNKYLHIRQNYELTIIITIYTKF